MNVNELGSLLLLISMTPDQKHKPASELESFRQKHVTDDHVTASAPQKKRARGESVLEQIYFRKFIINLYNTTLFIFRAIEPSIPELFLSIDGTQDNIIYRHTRF